MTALIDRLRALWAHGGLSMVLFALMAGCVAAWSMQHYLGSRVADIEASHRLPTVLRLVAAYDVAPGEPVSDNTLAVAEVPLQWAASEGLLPEQFEAWEGSVFAHGLAAGEQVLVTHLRARQPQSLASALAPGRRAVTVVVDETSSQAGMLQPGNRLDVYVTLSQAGVRRTYLLLSGMRVLAVGGRSEQNDAGPAEDASTITLDASPGEAARLVAARQTGTLGAVLQNEPSGLRSASMTTLPTDLQVALGLIAPPKARPPRQVPVLYGTDSSQADRTPSADSIFGTPEGMPW